MESIACHFRLAQDHNPAPDIQPSAVMLMCANTAMFSVGLGDQTTFSEPHFSLWEKGLRGLFLPFAVLPTISQTHPTSV